MAPAKSIAEEIKETQKTQIDIELYDGFTNVSPMVGRIIEDGYRQSQARGKWIFETLYAINKVKPFAKISAWLVSLFVIPALKRKILATRPRRIVIFHFFLIKPVLKIVRQNNLNTSVITVVTDPLTAHPIWFLEKNQHFIVFSEELKRYIVKAEGIEKKRISVFPFIVNPKFSKPATIQKQLAVRASLGIEAESKVILIMGGADGIPRGKELLVNLAQSSVDADVIIVCGRNKSLYRNALRIKQKYVYHRLYVLGYVDFVHELLSISEVVITKCGASTFMEILLSGKVPLVSSYIWEQEKGNVDFISQNGLGVFEPNPMRVATLAGDIIANEFLLKSFKNRIKSMRLENGTPLVSDFIVNFKEKDHEPTGNFRPTH